MGKRGPKPLPTKIKVLQGTVRPEDLKRSQPKPTPIAPKCPSWLPKETRRLWKELAPQLEELRLLTVLDGHTFAIMLMHLSFAIEAAKRIKAEGIVAEDERGLPRKHPLVQVLRDNSQAFKQYAAEFGLTPSARSRLDLADAKDPNDDLKKKYLR